VLIRPYIRYGLGGFALGWLGVIMNMMQLILIPDWVFLGFILMMFVSVAVLLLGLTRYSRCPACGKFPRARDNKVALKVENCTHCNEQLM
jgi:hypothetical protein